MAPVLALLVLFAVIAGLAFAVIKAGKPAAAGDAAAARAQPEVGGAPPARLQPHPTARGSRHCIASACAHRPPSRTHAAPQVAAQPARRGRVDRMGANMRRRNLAAAQPAAQPDSDSDAGNGSDDDEEVRRRCRGGQCNGRPQGAQGGSWQARCAGARTRASAAPPAEAARPPGPPPRRRWGA
jgi:hypothetical protein